MRMYAAILSITASSEITKEYSRKLLPQVHLTDVDFQSELTRIFPRTDTLFCPLGPTSPSPFAGRWTKTAIGGALRNCTDDKPTTTFVCRKELYSPDIVGCRIRVGIRVGLESLLTPVT